MASRLAKVEDKSKQQIINDLQNLIQEASDYNSWVLPDKQTIRQEYNVEYKNHTIYSYGDIWPTLEDFEKAVNNGEVIELTEDLDYEVGNRSHSEDMRDLVFLVSSYRSWPQYRNENTLKDAITRFINNEPMTMPIILRDNNGNMKIMSGNTRLDQAFMMKIKPKVLIVNIPNNKISN